MTLDSVRFSPGQSIANLRAADLNAIARAAARNSAAFIDTGHSIVELLADIDLDNSGSVQFAHYSGGWVLDGSSFTAFNIGPGNGLDGDHVTLFRGAGHPTLPFFEGQRPA